MKRVPSADPDHLVYRGGGGPLMVVGLPFIIMGIIVVSFGVSAVMHGDRSAHVPVLVGSVFAIAGLVMILGRRGLELDLKSRTYRCWWGLLFPWRSKSGSLDAFDRVGLRMEVRTNKNRRYCVYPALLTGPAGARLPIVQPYSYEASRKIAAELAKMLRVPLEDSTSGSDIVRDPDHVDEPMRERLRREGKPPVDPGGPPANLRTRFELDGKTIRFQIPPSGVRLVHLLPLTPLILMELIFTFVFLLPALRQGGAAFFPDIQFLVFAAVLSLVPVLPLVLIGQRVFSRARTVHTVDASPQALRVETRTPFSTRTVEIPSDAILDVEISRAVPSSRRGASAFEPRAEQSIVIRSPERALAFGGHLGNDEKRWIRDVLEQVLSA